MKKAALLGLDKVDKNDSVSFFCKGIILSLLGYSVDVFYDPQAEHMSPAKAELIDARFPNLRLHQLDRWLTEGDLKLISEADVIIVNPMPYSDNALNALKSFGRHIYFDLSGLDEEKAHYNRYAHAGYFVYLDSKDIELRVQSTMRDIVADEACFAGVFDRSGSLSVMDDDGHLDYISLFVEPTAGNFFFLASQCLSAIIYGLEAGYTISESIRLATILVEITTAGGDDSIARVSAENLSARYHEEFENLNDE